MCPYIDTRILLGQNGVQFYAHWGGSETPRESMSNSEGIAQMLNSKYQRYSERLRDLIEEGKAVAKLERPSSVGPYIQDEDKIQAHGWLTKTRNILSAVFGNESIQVRQFEDVLPSGGIKHVEHSYDVYPIIGVLSGALDDLEEGFLINQEFLIADEVFDSILGEAKQLARTGYKDCAAVLARTVLENSLKRLARSEKISEDLRASVINDELRKKGKYSQSQWRYVQAWLDIGNAAAHGKFNEYNSEDVSNLIGGLEKFLATEFRG